MEMDIRPLKGVRVIDLTMFVAGPSAAMVLADWGADVIKLEGLKGDTARILAGGPGSVLGYSTYNYWWEVYNRNKRAIALDMHHPKGREVVYRLVEKSDIFLSNLRGYSLSKLGFTYEELSRINPRLIYCHSVACGHRGPDKDRVGFDELTFWARSGLMAQHGEPTEPPPMERGVTGDAPTGICLVAACMMGLFYREQTGKGLEVNTSLYAMGVYVNAWGIQEYLGSGRNLERFSRKESDPLFNTYPTKDGWVMVSMLEGKRYWPEFCRALDREDLIDDPRFNRGSKRRENCRLLISLLDEVFSRCTTEEWKARFRDFQFPWEPVQTADQVVVDPQVVANDFLVEVDSPVWGRQKQVASPVQVHRNPFKPYRPAPQLGQHTEEVLQELGYTPEDTGEMEAAGLINCGRAQGNS